MIVLQVVPVSLLALILLLSHPKPADAVGCPPLERNSFGDGVRTRIENGVANFRCRNARHYDIVGPTNKTCNETLMKWTPEGIPLCKPFCVSTLTGLRHSVGETIIMQKDCKGTVDWDTNVARAVTNHTCQANGTWTQPLVDHCRSCICSEPAPEIGGAERFRISSPRCLREGTKAYYRCKRGKGGIQVCRGGKWQWRGSAPTCEPKRKNRKNCNAVQLPYDVVIKSDVTHYVREIVFNKGEAILLECSKQGQQLHGSKRALCTRRGWKYHKSEPRCVNIPRNNQIEQGRLLRS